VSALAIVATSVTATGQSNTKTRAENGLVGVKLFDNGAKLIAMFGNPMDIQPVGVGGAAVGPTGGAGGAGGAGAPAAGGRVSNSGSGGAVATPNVNRPFNPFDTSFGNEMLFQGMKGGVGPEGDDEGAARGGPRIGGQGGAPRGGGGGNANIGGTGTNADRILFTRWIYKRGNSRYAFVLDKTSKVVQIEALGLSDAKVRTFRGATFGATFGDIVKKYGAPEGYEISGNTIVMRYLIGSKVAFRLNRLGKDQPHKVTGVVVSGGKL